MKRRSYPGSSIMEYALPLVVFFGAATIFTVMADVPGQLALMFNNGTDGEQTGNKVKVSAFNKINVPGFVEQFDANNPLQPGEEMMCTSSGLCLNIPVIGDGNTSIETAGGLGGEEIAQMTDVLEQLTDQLEAQGADPSLIAMIQALANKGHNLGDSISALAALCPGGTCNTTNKNAIDPYFNDAKAKKNQFNTAWAELEAYMAANPQLLGNTPEAADIIAYEAEMIKQMAEQLGISQNVTTIPGGQNCGYNYSDGGDSSDAGGDGDDGF